MPKNLRELAARVAQKEFVYPVESAFITTQNQAKLKPRDQIKRMRNLPDGAPYVMLPAGHGDGSLGPAMKPLTTCAVVVGRCRLTPG